MRPNQNKRMRGRNGNRKGPNPLTRTYESNGPDVKIRGTAHHVAEKYLQLARDAQSSGDPVMAENYLQHAEHYFRIIAAAQQAQQQLQMGYARQGGETDLDDFDNDDEEAGIPDRFASPSPGFNQGGYGAMNGPQPQYPSSLQPQAQNYGERPPYAQERSGADRPYQDRNQRQERPYQDRNNQNYQDRNNQNRSNPNRGQRDQRQQRDFRIEQPRGDVSRIDAPRSETSRGDARSDAPQPGKENEGSALPAFITAPVRLPASDSVNEPPPINGAEPEQNEMGGFHLRPRRRRRNRPAVVESGGATRETQEESELPPELPLDE